MMESCCRDMTTRAALCRGLLKCVVGVMMMGTATGLKAMTLEELRASRKALAHRPRRVIANNDGCDCLYYPVNEEATAKGFLDKRTTDIAGKHVDTIAYCSISSGFSHFTHHTQVGTVLTRQGVDYGIQPKKRNITQDLIDQGADCLKLVVDFAHEHGMEAFWSMRMNDTHDVSHHPDKPYFLFPTLKETHPEWLVGDPVKRTPHGRWSSVNYAVPEVRDLAFAYIQEVCQGYDVDGVELDFFRHLCYFPETAKGGVATDEERGLMTELMRRVRTMTEEVGLKRGRPILVSIRVPDSVGYCRDMGFDLEKWLEEGLIDILVTTCYFRLNPWSYSVDLGRKHGVAVYPCLSDSRVRGEVRFKRRSLEGYRGRAMNVWASGASGLHLFNNFSPRSPIWEEIGDPTLLATKTKLYFATVRDGDPRSYLKTGRSYRTTPVLTPAHPVLFTGDRRVAVPVHVGRVPAADADASITCHVRIPSRLKPEQVSVSLNDTVLQNGQLKEEWLDYAVPAGALKPGDNLVSIGVVPRDPGAEATWSISTALMDLPGAPWERDPGSSATTVERVESEGVRIADRGTNSGDYCYFRNAWGASFEAGAVAEVEAKVVSGESCLIISDSQSGERLVLAPGHIT
ncbi:MAG: family 10 glycosylhydrolase, partial [Lentisphaerae bacterium]|nr:family 10 glycosylhydrolase [Lentisphaerota bacterium]